MTKAHSLTVMHSSDRCDWRTPGSLFEALDHEFHFHLDVAADNKSRLCELYLGPGGLVKDALAQSWHEVLGESPEPTIPSWFLNPPYSRKLAAAYKSGEIRRNGKLVKHPKSPAQSRAMRIENWAKRAWHEGQTWPGVAVLPYSPQTLWWRTFVDGIGPFHVWEGYAAHEVRKLPHRVTFLRPDGEPADNAPGNTAIVIYRPDPGYCGPWSPVYRYWDYL